MGLPVWAVTCRTYPGKMLPFKRSQPHCANFPSSALENAYKLGEASTCCRPFLVSWGHAQTQKEIVQGR